MASHGKKRHLKRMASSRSLDIAKKGSLWLKKPIAGKHSGNECIPMGVLLREVLQIADTNAQAKQLLVEGEVLLDCKKLRDVGTPVGLMDSVSIPKLGKYYRIVVKKGALKPIEISESDSKFKLCKVTNKRLIGKGKVQLNLHDGRNIIAGKDEKYSTRDSVKISLPGGKADGLLKFEKGAVCYVYRGKHAGSIAEFVEAIKQAGSREDVAKLIGSGGELLTQKNYLFVVDKEFKA